MVLQTERLKIHLEEIDKLMPLFSNSNILEVKEKIKKLLGE